MKKNILEEVLEDIDLTIIETENYLRFRNSPRVKEELNKIKVFRSEVKKKLKEMKKGA